MINPMRPKHWRTLFSALVCACGLIGLGISLALAGNSNVRATLHNLSVTGAALSSGGQTRPIATSETEVCVFCHTPHNGASATTGPLWNRSANVQTYTRYTSASLDANNIANGFNDQPGGSSLLCLSCHDGTVALGEVRVAPRNGGTSIAMTGGDGKMPTNYGVNTGFTRIGTDLTNDHPISITYNDALATADGELASLNSNQRDTGTSGALIGPRESGYKPLLPLERTGPVGGDGKKLGQIQCATCHDPHLNKTKFLRLNRLQANAAPSGGSFNQTNDIICLACHTKLGDAWAQSAHANPAVADETYTAAAAALRNFPTGTQVWQAACLNCHDTHTVQGSRRLLREGVGTANSALTVASGPAAGALYQPGVNPQPVNGTDGNNASSAIENTCFQCHRDPGGVNAITAATGTVPKIKTLFDLPYGMPARSDDQADPNNLERHNIQNADLTEPQTNLGRNDPTARHAECPDCHNPHRLVRNSKFNKTGDNTIRTHRAGIGVDGNIPSGVLRGGWGVEPVFSNIQMSVWPKLPDSFTVKKGDPGANTSTLKIQAYLTREYQLCFKCHSNYANSDLKDLYPAIGYASAIRGTSRRGTPLSYSNGMLNYTNVASEFGSVNAAVDGNGLAVSGTDQGEYSNDSNNKGTACGGGDCQPVGSTTNGTTTETINHRSWHPVMWPTGRDKTERRITASANNSNIRPPFEANMGKQTMQCTDCHGQSSSYTPGVGPIDTEPQGPHGSQYPFLLRGDWSLSTTQIGSLTNQICGNCHNPGGSGGSSGFLSNHKGGQGAMQNAPCMFCHIAVPHGWRNKAFLVNLNCVGTEGGQAGNCVKVSSNYTAKYLPPYYNGAKIHVNTWARSGSWQESTCTDGMTSCGSSF